MWVRNKDGIMENVNLSNCFQEKDKFKKMTFILTNKMLYNYELQKQRTQEDFIRLLCELSLN